MCTSRKHKSADEKILMNISTNSGFMRKLFFQHCSVLLLLLLCLCVSFRSLWFFILFVLFVDFKLRTYSHWKMADASVLFCTIKLLCELIICKSMKWCNCFLHYSNTMHLSFYCPTNSQYPFRPLRDFIYNFFLFKHRLFSVGVCVFIVLFLSFMSLFPFFSHLFIGQNEKKRINHAFEMGIFICEWLIASHHPYLFLNASFIKLNEWFIDNFKMFSIS